MGDEADKNGGPNHLRAWRLYRGLNGAQLAKLLKITPGMVSDFENGKRALTAKWLRRMAPVLRTTPGLLLDHDPASVAGDIVDIYSTASSAQRRQIVENGEA